MSDVILDWLAEVSQDPVRFVCEAFPWGEPGQLEKFDGPQAWQLDILSLIRDGLADTNTAIQIAVASGHGIGKSALVSWIILWAFSTAPDTRGVVTANTEMQLKTKTWAELGRWFNAFIAKEHFIHTATAIMSKDPSRERTWRVDMIPWSEKNPEAFAGLHNKGKRLFMIMDEASAVHDIIWETAEGALTDADTEIIQLAFGNPTRNTGRFRECFPGGRFEKFWKSRKIDSRTVPITNKARLQSWIEAYGEDSDFVRVRVLGEFPRKGLMEFFSAVEIDEAMKREVHVSLTDPLAVGVDVARFGANNSVMFFRKGRDARTIERKVFNGIDTVQLASHVMSAHTQYRPDGIFIDGGGVGGGVVDNVRNMRLHCFEVQFGGKDVINNSVWGNTGERYANNRAAMYGMARAWIKTGALPNDPELKRQLLAIKYTFDKNDNILLERKEDLIDEDGVGVSVDDADAFVLTFAYTLSPNASAGGDYPHKPEVTTEYDPFSADRMVA